MWPVFFCILVLVSIPSVCWLKGRRMGLCVVTGGGYQRLWPCHTKPEDLSSNPPLGWKALNEIIHSPDCRHSSGTPLLTPTSETVSLYSGREKAVKSKKVFCFLFFVMRRKREKEKEEENQPCRSHVSVHCDEQLELEHKTLSLHLVFTLHSEQKERERETQLKECQWHLLPWAPQWRSIEIILTQPSLTKTPLYMCVCLCVCSQSMWSGTPQHLDKAMSIVPSKDETLKLLFCIII